MKKLMRTAEKLGRHTDTDWAYEHEDAYQAFAEEIENLYAEGMLTGTEFNELALTAFYDYPDMKEEE